MVSSPGFRRIMTVAAQQMPQVQWEIRQLGFLGCYEALTRDEVDCAFVAEIGAAEGVEALPLWEEGCVAVLSERHRLAGRESVALAELADETFVDVQDETASSRWLSAVAAPEGAVPKVLSVARGFEEVLELVGAGLGINIAGTSAPETYAREGLRFVPVIDAPTATTYLCLRPGRGPSALEEFARRAVRVSHSRP
ncbi:LysR family substrate-binding domain-containing protein [Kocuria sp. U4B]